MSAPLQFKELQIRNFLSFGNQLTTINLGQTASTLIVGENIDANSNNGAGKCISGSTLINVRNKRTGKITTVRVSELYDQLLKQKTNYAFNSNHD